MKQATLALLLCTSLARGQAANEVFDELVSIGIQIPAGPRVKLPAPLLGPGRAVKVDAELLDKIADKVPVELFLKRSAMAPIAVKFDSIEDGKEQRCGQLITLRFVAYGKLEAVTEGDVLKRLVGGKAKAGKGQEDKAAALTPQELQKRGISMSDGPKLKEAYSTVSMSLLDKVRIEGVTRNMMTTRADAVVYATRLDERFSKDKDYPNQWRPIVGAGDNATLGEPQPYAGLGGYVLVTPLPKDAAPPGALLIEMCFVLHEPMDWFGGRNLLRAKMPLALQENVRSFRRQIERD